jgi:N-acetylneuraminic acid mutarotase
MTEAIGPPRRRGRPLFGLLDPDGWAWASLKAFFWFIVILFLLGYLPDRAYYFTVNPTIDLGINAVSPVNFCPPDNRTLPCPAPAGAILPWQKSPTELNLPEPRRDGAAVQAGTNLLYIGGTDGKTASDKVFVSQLFGDGNFSPWHPGPDLPEPRSRLAAAFFNGSIYVAGGDDASGKPTTTTWVLTPDATTGQLGAWKAAADTSGNKDPKLDLKLPEARDGAVLVPAADGLFLVGGGNGSGAVNTVWKSTVDTKGAPHAWAPSGGPMPGARTDGIAVLSGDFMYVYGGTDGKAPTSAVWIAQVGKDSGGASQVTAWATNLPALPAPRTSAAGFVANQAIYLVGGSDGTTPKSELYWTVPDSVTGMIKEWKHLSQSDLPTGGLAASTAAISGSYVFLVGGQTTEGVAPSSLRSNLAPKPPFFQLGLVGATVPGLKIEGDIGPQLGLLAAAGVGTGNFILLLAIGYVFAHKAQVRAFLEGIRERRRREA